MTNTKMAKVRVGGIAQWLAYLLPDPATLGSNHKISEFFSEKNIMMLS